MLLRTNHHMGGSEDPIERTVELGRIPNDEWIARLSSSNVSIRVKAATALSEFIDKRSIEALKEATTSQLNSDLLSDPAWYEAVKALRHIGLVLARLGATSSGEFGSVILSLASTYDSGMPRDRAFAPYVCLRTLFNASDEKGKLVITQALTSVLCQNPNSEGGQWLGTVLSVPVPQSSDKGGTIHRQFLMENLIRNSLSHDSLTNECERKIPNCAE